MREAAEQCETTFLPDVAALTPLPRVLSGWDPARRILWADESAVRTAEGATSPAALCAGLPPGPWAILIGPEGGFSEKERAHLRSLPFVVPIALGPRILRAETAALALMTLWQAHLGDWV